MGGRSPPGSPAGDRAGRRPQKLPRGVLEGTRSPAVALEGLTSSDGVAFFKLSAGMCGTSAEEIVCGIIASGSCDVVRSSCRWGGCATWSAYMSAGRLCDVVCGSCRMENVRRGPRTKHAATLCADHASEKFVSDAVRRNRRCDLNGLARGSCRRKTAEDFVQCSWLARNGV